MSEFYWTDNVYNDRHDRLKEMREENVRRAKRQGGQNE